MQEMKEKELKYIGNGDANSHVCKVCFESPTAAILLPCRHFCCKSSQKSKLAIPLNFQIFVRILTPSCLLLQCVNRAHLLVLSAQYAAQILQIGFLLLHLDPIKRGLAVFLQYVFSLFKCCTIINLFLSS